MLTGKLAPREQKVVEEVEEVLTVVSRYDGRVYGDYVRQVIVPLLQGANSLSSFTGPVTIWFTETMAADDCRRALEKRGLITIQDERRFRGEEVEYQMVVSERHPGAVVDVDLITYQVFDHKYFTQRNHLLNAVRNKQAMLLPGRARPAEWVRREGWTVTVVNTPVAFQARL